MSQAQTQNQDFTHEKPAEVDDVKKPASSEETRVDEGSEKTIYANVDSKADTSAPTRKQMNRTQLQFTALCWTLFLTGWNDGSTGPLLPRIQRVYNVGYFLVSLVFVLACVGYLLGAVTNVPLSEKHGMGKALIIGSLCQVVAYSIQSPGLPFPVYLICFALNSFGIAIQDSQAIGYVASIKDRAETRMGILAAGYGLGALLAPIVATQFAQARHWSFHYLISLGIAISNTIFLITVFRFKTYNECLIEIGQPAPERGTSSHSALRQILSQKTVHLLAFFTLIYIGVEVTIGGWIVTFIIRARGGGATSGYISTGFFGGLMLGRVALLWVNKKVGEHRVLFIYAILAIGLEFVVWFVPSVVGDAVAVSLVGIALGPMYPITMNRAGHVIPQWMLTGSVGWIAGFGQAGSAVLPFMTGALSSRFGIKSLQPLLVAMMSVMTVMWAFVPTSARRAD